MSQADRILAHLKTGEEFRPIPGFEGFYECSLSGVVRSVGRTVRHPTGSPKQWPGRVLKQTRRSAGGYCMVSFSKHGKTTAHSVHRLVALTWVPNPDGLPHVAHLDGDSGNNDARNLAWVSPAENESHKVLHGTRPQGERVHNATLTEAVVRQVRAMSEQGLRCHEIATALGLNYYTAWGIARGQSWRHVQ